LVRILIIINQINFTMSFARPLLRAAARPQVLAPIRGAARRTYSSAPAAKSNTALYAGLAAAAAGGAGYYLYTQGQLGPLNDKIARPTIFKPTFEDYQKVYNDIAETLEDNDFDDGSYGPVSILFPNFSGFFHYGIRS
jgi:cytochrome c peroxidase